MTWRVIELDKIDVYTLHAMEDVLYDMASKSDKYSTIVFSKVKPGISIASTQNYHLDIDEDACLRDRVDVTRRKTGGRSMYLDENYFVLSLITNEHDYNNTKQYESTIGLINKALHDITGHNYSLANKNDIVVDGKKIGGAAQRNSPNYNLVHCYIRVGGDLHKMLKYLKIDGVKLDTHYDDVRKYVTSISDFHNPANFYEKFRDALTSKLDHKKSDLTAEEFSLIEKKANEYSDMNYVRGRKDYPSKGNCDIIEGSGKDAKLKIQSLEGRVKFS